MDSDPDNDVSDPIIGFKQTARKTAPDRRKPFSLNAEALRKVREYSSTIDDNKRLQEIIIHFLAHLSRLCDKTRRKNKDDIFEEFERGPFYEIDRELEKIDKEFECIIDGDLEKLFKDDLSLNMEFSFESDSSEDSDDTMSSCSSTLSSLSTCSSDDSDIFDPDKDYEDSKTWISMNTCMSLQKNISLMTMNTCKNTCVRVQGFASASPPAGTI